MGGGGGGRRGRGRRGEGGGGRGEGGEEVKRNCYHANSHASTGTQGCLGIHPLPIH